MKYNSFLHKHTQYFSRLDISIFAQNSWFNLMIRILTSPWYRVASKPRIQKRNFTIEPEHSQHIKATTVKTKGQLRRELPQCLMTPPTLAPQFFPVLGLSLLRALIWNQKRKKEEEIFEYAHHCRLEKEGHLRITEREYQKPGWCTKHRLVGINRRHKKIPILIVSSYKSSPNELLNALHTFL